MTSAERLNQESGEVPDLPDGDLFSLPLALRTAAYISFGGRAYRLFPENEISPLGEAFHLEGFQVSDGEECPQVGEIEQPAAAEIELLPENSTSNNSAENILPFFDVTPDDVSTEPSIKEKIRRSRAVEGVCRPVVRHQEFFEKRKPSDSAPSSVNSAPHCLKFDLSEVLEEKTKSGESKPQTPSDFNRICFPRSSRVTLPFRATVATESLRKAFSNVMKSIPEEADPEEIESQDEPIRENLPPVSEGISVESLLLSGPHFSLVRKVCSDESREKPKETTLETPEKPECDAPSLEQVLAPPVSGTIADEKESSTVSVRRLVLFQERKFGRLPQGRRSATFHARPWKPAETSVVEIEAENEVAAEPVSAEPIVTENVVFTLENEPSPMETESIPGWQLLWQPAWPRELASLEHRASGQVRSLADHLETQYRSGCRIISFNGLVPGDGCTTMSLCASRELAERGYRLLLADAHHQNPELARLLEIHLDPHIYEIVTLIPERLELLPWSETPIEIDEGQTRSFEELIVSMQPEFDLVLLDNGPLIGSSLPQRVRSWRQMNIDGVLLICNAKSPDRRRLQGVSQRLEEHDIKLFGVTENYVPGQ